MNFNSGNLFLIAVVLLLRFPTTPAFRKVNNHVSWNRGMLQARSQSSNRWVRRPAMFLHGSRKDFPFFRTGQNNTSENRIIYFDNAATSQKPSQVIDQMKFQYERQCANVHRGIHHMSNVATEDFENARDKVASFINAGSPKEIIFTRGATEGINLVANTWGFQNLKAGDEIVLSMMEHHSNIVPWQMLAAKTGAKLKYIRLDSSQSALDMEHFHTLLCSKTKLVSIAHASNVLGCINPIQDIVMAAHKVGALVLLDACQTVPHMPLDVRELDVDFLVASGHKMCGPTGIGFCYGKLDHLMAMPPWQGGGEMISEVYLHRSVFQQSPSKFEAGTPAIVQAIGLGHACDYLRNTIGLDKINVHGQELGKYLYEKLDMTSKKGNHHLKLLGPNPKTHVGTPRLPLVSFVTPYAHSHDIAQFLDQDKIAIRSGHHCTQPLHREIGVSGSARASCYFYNNREEIDFFVERLESILCFFRDSKSANKKLEDIYPNKSCPW